MPSKNVIKTYKDNSYYHLYNRGVNKTPIFKDKQDYKVFLSYLKTYLTPLDTTGQYQSRISNNFHQSIILIAYCLMPNHFHLLLQQKNAQDINFFMRSINTKYVRYFNTKYDRVGTLYQGSYKAVLVESNEQLLHLSRYIHQNPSTSRRNLEVYPYSSLNNYLGKINQSWINPQSILDFFSATNPNNSYESFVFEKEINTTKINHLTID